MQSKQGFERAKEAVQCSAEKRSENNYCSLLNLIHVVSNLSNAKMQMRQ